MYVVLFEMYNPFRELKPELGPFAEVLGNPIRTLLALVWAIGFCVAGGYVIVGLMRLAQAHRRNQGGALEAAKEQLMLPLLVIVLLAALPALFAIFASGVKNPTQ